MRNLFSLLIAVALLGATAQAADTNTVNTTTNAITAPTLSLEKSESEKGMPKELQLGGSGVTNPKTGETEFGLNFSFSCQPTKYPVWVGISQELGWSPSFAAATDLDVAPSLAIIKDKLYLNYGWSVGATYDRTTLGWRTGPELSLEYYTTGNAFIIAGANYDLFTKQNASSGWVTAKDNALRYYFGVGIAF